MSVYPPPKVHNGSLNTVFNRDDYVQTSTSSGTTQVQNDSRYLRNTGIVVSSGSTTFNNTVNIEGLATLNNLEVSSLFKSKQFIDTLVPIVFSSSQSYSFNNGMVYYLVTNNTSMTTLSITDIPTTPMQSYIFTFILRPNTPNNAFYLKPNTNFISVNNISTVFNGLSKLSVPTLFNYLVQQITVINLSVTETPDFIALTSISGY